MSSSLLTSASYGLLREGRYGVNTLALRKTWKRDIVADKTMNRLGRALLLNALTYLTAVALPAVENLHGETNSLPNAKRIVFLGDSITYGGEYVSLLESY